MLTAVLSVVTYAAQRNAGAVAALESVHYSIDSRTRCSPTIDICRKLFWPADLAIFYPISKTYSSWQIGAALVLLIAISIAVYSSSGRRPWLGVGWFWFLGMLVPVIGLVQVGIQ
ncbi:MAG: hypothetical protein DMG17_31030 [Acidobacteria bacterium]|nr:MAG: hypothetical protein DMG17_31030 [Acidobacteriota bacterium]